MITVLLSALSLVACQVNSQFDTATLNRKPLPFKVVWKSTKSSKPKKWSTKSSYPSLTPITPFTSYFNQQVRAFVTDQVSEHVKFCSEMDNSGAHAMWDLNLHFTMGDANPTFGSTWVSSYSYTGGAHPNTVYKTFNIGLKNNRPVMLTINDLTGGDAQKMSGLEAKLVAELRYRKASSVEADPNFKLDPKLLNNFVVTPAGATWLFSPYEVASYAEGPFFVKFSRTEMRPYIDQNGPFGFIAK